MDIAAGFVPGAEIALGDAFANALRRPAEPGIFPVVDGRGAVGGQVGQPALRHHSFEDQGGAIAEEMGAVDQHDGCLPPLGGDDGPGLGFDGGGNVVGN